MLQHELSKYTDGSVIASCWLKHELSKYTDGSVGNCYRSED